MRNAQRLLAALENGALTLTQISTNVFRGNLARTQIEAVLGEIEDCVTLEERVTNGRNATILSLRDRYEARNRRNTLYDKTFELNQSGFISKVLS